MNSTIKIIGIYLIVFIISLIMAILQITRQLIEQVSTLWMKNALLSEMEKKLNNPDKAMYYAKHALDHAKGLQKYILYKTYQREFPENVILY